jgi:hypothetical protein
MKREGLPVILSNLGSDLVTLEALRQAAVAKGLEKGPEAKARMTFQEEDALAAACQERIQKDLPAFSSQERDAV